MTCYIFNRVPQSTMPTSSIYGITISQDNNKSMFLAHHEMSPTDLLGEPESRDGAE